MTPVTKPVMRFQSNTLGGVNPTANPQRATAMPPATPRPTTTTPAKIVRADALTTNQRLLANNFDLGALRTNAVLGYVRDACLCPAWHKHASRTIPSNASIGAEPVFKYETL